jgi:hypothetical protein
MGYDDIDAEPHEFFSELLGTIASPVGIAEFDLDVLALRVAEGVQAAPEGISERMRRDADTSTPMTGNFPDCCARAARGHAAAALASAARKCRRAIETGVRPSRARAT